MEGNSLEESCDVDYLEYLLAIIYSHLEQLRRAHEIYLISFKNGFLMEIIEHTNMTEVIEHKHTTETSAAVLRRKK